VAVGEGQSPAALAQPVSALAHRNLLGPARGTNIASRVPDIPMASPGRTAAIPALGRKDEIGSPHQIIGRIRSAAANSFSRSVN